MANNIEFMSPMDDEIMTLQEVAAYLKLAERTVYGYAQKNLLPGIKVGSAWRFRKQDILAWLEDQRRLTEKSTSKKHARKGA